MIPIHLSDRVVRKMWNREYEFKVKCRSIGDLLLSSMCLAKADLDNVNYLKRKIKMKREGMVVKMKNTEVDYMDVLDGLNEKEQAFFLLYHSKNYVYR